MSHNQLFGVQRYEVGADGKLWEVHTTARFNVQSMKAVFAIKLLDRLSTVEVELERLKKELSNGSSDV